MILTEGRKDPITLTKITCCLKI